MQPHIVCARTGLDYKVSKVIAKDGDSQLVLSQIYPKQWQFLSWDMESSTISQVGEQYDTQGLALLYAYEYAKGYGFRSTDILVEA